MVLMCGRKSIEPLELLPSTISDRCTATLARCRDTPKIGAEDIPDLMQALPSWKLNEKKDMLSKCFVARNFVAGQQLAAGSWHCRDR
jgi:hypothetical protein